MATIEVQGDQLVLRLSPWEKAGALHADLRIPRSAVVAVTTRAPAMAAVTGLRIMGTGIPRVVALGTRVRGRAGRDLVAVYARHPGSVILDLLPGTGFRRVIVSAADPEALAATLRPA